MGVVELLEAVYVHHEQARRRAQQEPEVRDA